MDALLEKLGAALLAAGPWGILNFVLLILLALSIKGNWELFKLFAGSQQTRIDEALKSQEAMRSQSVIIQQLTEILADIRQMIPSVPRKPR